MRRVKRVLAKLKTAMKAAGKYVVNEWKGLDRFDYIIAGGGIAAVRGVAIWSLAAAWIVGGVMLVVIGLGGAKWASRQQS